MRVTEEGSLKETIKTVTAEEIVAIEPMLGRNPSPKKRKAAMEDFPMAEARTVKRLRPSSPSNRTFNLRDDSSAMTSSSGPPSLRAHARDLNPNMAASSCDTAEWIKSRHPSNPDLYCCDYNQVEADIKDGFPGKEEFGGAYLCLECLGFEYRDEVDPNEH